MLLPATHHPGQPRICSHPRPTHMHSTLFKPALSSSTASAPSPVATAAAASAQENGGARWLISDRRAAAGLRWRPGVRRRLLSFCQSAARRAHVPSRPPARPPALTQHPQDCHATRGLPHHAAVAGPEHRWGQRLCAAARLFCAWGWHPRCPFAAARCPASPPCPFPELKYPTTAEVIAMRTTFYNRRERGAERQGWGGRAPAVPLASAKPPTPPTPSPQQPLCGLCAARGAGGGRRAQSGVQVGGRAAAGGRRTLGQRARRQAALAASACPRQHPDPRIAWPSCRAWDDPRPSALPHLPTPLAAPLTPTSPA